jgi:ribosome maturation factor RimP
MELEASVREAVTMAVELCGYELLRVRYDPRRRVEANIDAPNGASLDDCATATRAIGDALRDRGFDPRSFHVEVASAGIDRLLVKEEHFLKYRGLPVLVRLRDKVDGRRKVKGTLTGCRAGRISVRENGTEYTFTLEEIEEARLAPDLAEELAKSSERFKAMKADSRRLRRRNGT